MVGWYPGHSAWRSPLGPADMLGDVAAVLMGMWDACRRQARPRAAAGAHGGADHGGRADSPSAYHTVRVPPS